MIRVTCLFDNNGRFCIEKVRVKLWLDMSIVAKTELKIKSHEHWVAGSLVRLVVQLVELQIHPSIDTTKIIVGLNEINWSNCIFVITI